MGSAVRDNAIFPVKTKSIDKQFVCLLMFATALIGFNASATSAKQTIIWATPYWPNYTSAESKGLYHDIISEVFPHDRYDVQILQRPFRRALNMVQQGKADIAGADDENTLLLQSEFPILTSTEVALYRIADIPDFTDIKKLSRKVGVWYDGYIDNLPGLTHFTFTGFGVKDRKTALAMLINQSRNVSFYFDNNVQLMRTLETSNIALDTEKFAVKPLFTAQLHMFFSNNERGMGIKSLYDEGINRAFCNNRLALIYDKWGEKLPPLDIDCNGLAQW